MTKSHPSNLCPFQNLAIRQSCHDGREEARIGWPACFCGRPFYFCYRPGSPIPATTKSAEDSRVIRDVATLETNFVLLVVFVQHFDGNAVVRRPAVTCSREALTARG
jgi:hypothetical protein